MVTEVPVNTLVLGNIWGVNATTALVTGTDASSVVYKTTNGGANWTQVFSQPGGFINSIWMSTESSGFMMGDPVGGRWSLWKTGNSGSSWDSAGLYLPDTAGVFSFNNVLFSSGSNIWFGTNGRKIFYSSNYGTSWTAQAAPLNVTAVVWFNTPVSGMAGGSSILFTSTGGNSWAPLPGTNSLHGMTGYGTSWWYVRVIGTIYFSSNNGSNWSIVYTAPSGLNFHVAKARNNTSIWAVRSEGGISKYTATLSENINFIIWKISELKSNVDELVSTGNLRHAFAIVLNNSLNAASNQLSQGHSNIAVIKMLLFKFLVNNLINRGFLTEQLGEPLITSANEIIELIQGLNNDNDYPVRTSEASQYSLNQNYPNPFNPKTNISYTVQKKGLVKLIVYDALGREVNTLVNKVMDAGTHSVSFDGSLLSSGVYFYRLTAEGYTDIKKMVLIK
jgi:photosystem II stability/assembly factor-like uncharacterized protein